MTKGSTCTPFIQSRESEMPVAVVFKHAHQGESLLTSWVEFNFITRHGSDD